MVNDEQTPAAGPLVAVKADPPWMERAIGLVKSLRQFFREIDRLRPRIAEIQAKNPALARFFPDEAPLAHLRRNERNAPIVVDGDIFRSGKKDFAAVGRVKNGRPNPL